jgi:hypothetical protein
MFLGALSRQTAQFGGHSLIQPIDYINTGSFVTVSDGGFLALSPATY